VVGLCHGFSGQCSDFFKLFLWLFASALFGLWWCQGYLLYLPSFQGRSGEKRQIKHNVQGFRSPSDHRLPFEEHFITTADNVKVHSWLLMQDNPSVCPTIIFFHGNAGNIGFCLPNAKSLYVSTGCNILLVEYRGYGNSSGSPSEKGLKLDAQAALDFVQDRSDIDHKKIFIFGRSLGGAVSLDLALKNQDQVCGVIVENTFLSIDEMVLIMLPRFGVNRFHTLFRIFLRFYLTSHWNNSAIVGRLRVPTLFISGLSDELVPPSHMRQLHDCAVSCKRAFLGIEGGEHNDTYYHGGQHYYDEICKFVSCHIT